jgi:hypothetical protein
MKLKIFISSFFLHMLIIFNLIIISLTNVIQALIQDLINILNRLKIIRYLRLSSFPYYNTLNMLSLFVIKLFIPIIFLLFFFNILSAYTLSTYPFTQNFSILFSKFVLLKYERIKPAYFFIRCIFTIKTDFSSFH